jgi:DNA-binding HxlR family transcriptional regulator
MKKTGRSAGVPPHRSKCPIACALDLVGDRWTILVIRDLMRGLSRYGELLRQAEGIPTNILADRLVRLEEAKLVTRKPYQENPPRYAYELTPAGLGLGPTIAKLAIWGQRNVAGTRVDPELFARLSAQATVSSSREGLEK